MQAISSSDVAKHILSLFQILLIKYTKKLFCYILISSLGVSQMGQHRNTHSTISITPVPAELYQKVNIEHCIAYQRKHSLNTTPTNMRISTIKSDPIKIPRDQEWTVSELESVQDEDAAEYRDYCMFCRIVIGRRKAARNRSIPNPSLDNIIRTRQADQLSSISSTKVLNPNTKQCGNSGFQTSFHSDEALGVNTMARDENYFGNYYCSASPFSRHKTLHDQNDDADSDAIFSLDM